MSLTREQNLKRGEIDFPFYLGEFLAQIYEAETHLCWMKERWYRGRHDSSSRAIKRGMISNQEILKSNNQTIKKGWILVKATWPDTTQQGWQDRVRIAWSTWNTLLVKTTKIILLSKLIEIKHVDIETTTTSVWTSPGKAGKGKTAEVTFVWHCEWGPKVID